MSELSVDLAIGRAGRYKFGRYQADEDGNAIPDTYEELTGWINNLITNQGLNRIGTTNDWLTYVQVGSGSTAPVNADTGLASWIAGTLNVTSSVESAQGSAPYYVKLVRKWQFGVGAAAGTLAEVGVGWDISGATLYSRSLILDGGGSPTTITILANEILEVTYEHRVIPPAADTTGSFLISGVSYSYTARGSNVTSASGVGWAASGSTAGLVINTSTAFHGAYTGALGAITSSPGGSVASPTAITDAAYGNNDLFRDGTVTWGVTATNIGSYAAMVIQFSFARFQLSFTPSIPKTTINELKIVSRISWTRAVIP